MKHEIISEKRKKLISKNRSTHKPQITISTIGEQIKKIVRFLLEIYVHIRNDYCDFIANIR